MEQKKRDVFLSDGGEYANLTGMTFEIVHTLSNGMVRIKLENGVELNAFPQEVFKSHFFTAFRSLFKRKRAKSRPVLCLSSR